MKGQDALFSHGSDEWETPDKVYNRLFDEYKFGIDAAATEANHLAFYWWDKEHSALEANWLIPENSGKPTAVFLNPPHSQIAAFMKKSYIESLKGIPVVCLIPVRSDTRWWHEYVMRAYEIRFVKGRLKFNNRTLPSWREDGSHKTSSATFPSCIVIFDVEMKKKWFNKNPNVIFPLLWVF